MSSLSKSQGEAGSGHPALIQFFRHHGIWAPGVRLFRKLQFRSKAFIITAVFVLPLLTVGYSFFQSMASSIAFSAKEHDGMQCLQVALPVLRDALNVRSNAAHQDPTLSGAQASLQSSLKKLEAIEHTLGSSLGTSSAFKALKDAADKASSSPSATSVQAASELVAAARQLVTVATDGSNLTLDPDIDTFYLMDSALIAAPALTDSLHQMRDAALTRVSGGNDPQIARAILASEVLVTSLDQRIAEGLAKVYTLHPNYKAELRHDDERQAMKTFFVTASAA